MKAERGTRSSGYAGSVADWRRFLSCWYHEARGLDEKALVKRDVLAAESMVAALEEEIALQQARMGLTLPRSYVDFLLAYRPAERTFQDRDFVHISAVTTLEHVHPDLVIALQDADRNAPDDEYLVYGTAQRDETRSRHADTALVVGMHDSAPMYALVLHPEVLTSDGEMEAEIFFHAGSWRAPSFAEMMRFLYMYTVRMPAGAAGFSQEMMRGTCADLLPMEDVWWK